MTQTMLDRIALSVEEDFWSRWACGQPGPEWAIHAARAALTAMMEGPIPLSVGWDMYRAANPNNVDYFGQDLEGMFRAGIQAILNEGAEK